MPLCQQLRASPVAVRPSPWVWATHRVKSNSAQASHNSRAQAWMKESLPLPAWKMATTVALSLYMWSTWPLQRGAQCLAATTTLRASRWQMGGGIRWECSQGTSHGMRCIGRYKVEVFSIPRRCVELGYVIYLHNYFSFSKHALYRNSTKKSHNLLDWWVWKHPGLKAGVSSYKHPYIYQLVLNQ